MINKAALTPTIFLILTSIPAHAAGAVPQAPAIDLAPHRAIYDMSLRDALASSNVSDIRGRLVFDFEGSPCAGYTLKSRLVTQVVDREGNSTLTDLRSSTWENSDGDKFRFNSSQYIDQRLSDHVAGLAARGKADDAIEVTIDKPERRRMKFTGAALFPTQHSLAILEAARHGKSVLQADIYDGSEKGDKLYETTTFIGNPSAGSAKPGRIKVEHTEKLDGMASWPVSIGYYEPAADPARDDGLPTYELSFRLFANGVSRDLVIDYGTFSVRGTLSRIDFHKPTECADRGAKRRQSR
ncbi:MAG: cell envelope integrity EipB family protein [Rhodomicrobiaceae bacterium]